MIVIVETVILFAWSVTMLRIVLPQSATLNYDKAKPCVVCKEPTRHEKPWCSAHIDLSPYAQKLMAVSDAEIALHDVHLYLKLHGEATEAKLARMCCKNDLGLMKCIARQLKLKERKLSRGRLTYSL